MKPFVCVWLACLLILASGPGSVWAAGLDEAVEDRLYRENESPDQEQPRYHEQDVERSYRLPERYTIHKGKKCEIRCERRAWSGEYDCRENRC